jgi:O-antigen/teichoic acid export membrane protein
MKVGVFYTVLPLVGAVTYSSDSFLVAQIWGAAEVQQYAVPEKLFSLISTSAIMVLAPLWPAYGEAIARRDRNWIINTLRTSLIYVASVTSVLSTLLVVFAPTIINFWVHSAVTTSLQLLTGLGLWKVIECTGIALACFLNGARLFWLQVIIAVSTAIASIVLKVIFVREIGVAGVPWATILAYLTFAVLPIIFWRKKLLQRI